MNTLTKKIFSQLFFFSLLLFTLSLHAASKVRSSSEPYISGDTFRSYADYLFDETTTSFDPSKVAYGDIIFVKSDILNQFIKEKHPYISAPYVLITHNSDAAMPGNYSYLVDDPKILAWYAQNIETSNHEKLFHLPIGLANNHFKHGSTKVLSSVQKKLANISKKHLAYLNISVNTFFAERNLVYEKFNKCSYCYCISSPKSFENYLLDIASSKFVFSPRGNGIDCHRTWEALYLGSIPIVKTSALDPIYDGLPVLIVQDWDEVSEDFLNKAYHNIKSQQANLERLEASYWKKEFNRFKPVIND